MYSDKVAQKLSEANGNIESFNHSSIDLTTARMKSIRAQWITRASEYLQSYPDIIVNGFKAISRSIDAGKPVIDDFSDTEGDASSEEVSSDDDNSDEDEESVYFSSSDD